MKTSELLQKIASKKELKEFSHIRIGNSAEHLFLPESFEQLSGIMKFAQINKMPVIPLGGCSNLLFGKVENTVFISDKKLPEKLKIRDKSVIVSSNYGINNFIEKTRNFELGGLEFLAGIPAHIGGTIFMNAGAFEKNIAEYLKWIEIIDFSGNSKRIRKEDIDYSYRSSSISGFIIEAAFELEKKTSARISSDIEKSKKYRKEHHPMEFPSLGSVFKNPAGHYAGQLIEECGLKGEKNGGAEISEKHANFIINRNNAIFEDVIGLIEICRQKVREKFNIELEPEIRVIGK